MNAYPPNNMASINILLADSQVEGPYWNVWAVSLEKDFVISKVRLSLEHNHLESFFFFPLILLFLDKYLFNIAIREK